MTPPSAKGPQPETPVPVAPHAALTVIHQVQRQTGPLALVATAILSMTAFFAALIAGISSSVSLPALVTALVSGVPATVLLFRGLRSSREAEALRQANTLGPAATGELVGRLLIMREGQRIVTLRLSRSECARIRQLALPHAVATITA